LQDELLTKLVTALVPKLKKLGALPDEVYERYPRHIREHLLISILSFDEDSDGPFGAL
jgi:hypothetical protein